MSDEKNLRESLISAFDQLKLIEVTEEEIQKATPTMVSATHVYDDLIQALKSGTFWIN